MSHTKTPWEARECGDFGGWGIIAVEPMRGRVDSQITGMTEANARLIVRAVNAFEPMREALQATRDALNIGLQPFYIHADNSVKCKICSREWKININPDRTASALIEHNKNATCGIMHEALQQADAALALADKEKP